MLRLARGPASSCRCLSLFLLGKGDDSRFGPRPRCRRRFQQRVVLPRPRWGETLLLALVKRPAILHPALVGEASKLAVELQFLMRGHAFVLRLAADHEAERAVLKLHLAG